MSVSSVNGSTTENSNIAGWDKTVADVNNVDESFANARDLGWSRLNDSRISVIATLDPYDNKDMYMVQVQSNGKLFINLRSGDSTDDGKVLDLSKYETRLNEIKSELEAMGIKTEEEEIDTTPKTPLEIARAEVEKMKEEREKANKGLLDDLAEGMTIKVYMKKGNRTVTIGDSTADKNSEEYANMKAILSGEYKAKKGYYYIEIGSEAETPEASMPYVMQIRQGDKYRNDYLVTETKSSDSQNETISLTSSTSSAEYISAAYAAQIQAQKYEATATLMSDAYTNLASIRNKQSKATQLFSTLLNV